MGIDVVVDAEADRRARELAVALGASVLRTPAEVEDLLERWGAASRARDVRGVAIEARLLRAALAPEEATRHMGSLLDQLHEAHAQAARVATARVLAPGTDAALVRAAAAEVRRTTEVLRAARTQLGVPLAGDVTAESSHAAARAVLAGAKASAPNAAMRLGYVATGNGIALMLVGLGAPSMLVVSVLCLVVIAGVQQLVVARRTVRAARPREARRHRARRDTSAELGAERRDLDEMEQGDFDEMERGDLDEWHQRAEAVLAAESACANAFNQWHHVAGADVDVEDVDELLAATEAVPWREQLAMGLTWPEHEWASALARLELDPCPASAPDRALAQLARRLTDPQARGRAARRLEEVLEGRALDDLLEDLVVCAAVPLLNGKPVVLADPFRDLEPSRRNALLRRLGECDNDGRVTLVTSDAEAEAWLAGPGRARG